MEEKNYENIFSEEQIDRKINEIFVKRRSKLIYREKREKAIKELNKKYNLKYEDDLDFQNCKLILFDINAIQNSIERKLQQEVEKRKKEEKYSQMKDSDIRDIILEENNDSEYYEKIRLLPENKINNINDTSKSIMDKTLLKESIASTNDASSFNKYTIYEEKWIQLKLYDINYFPTSVKNPESIFEYNNKFKKYHAFEYKDDYKTYSLTQSKFFSKDNDYLILKKETKNFNEEYGLCFCGKKIEEYNKYCSPDQMICKDCIKETKEIYGLDKSSLLINIHGRICKKLKEKNKDILYYCLGKFTNNIKQITICYPGDIMCKSCKFINDNINYYKSA